MLRSALVELLPGRLTYRHRQRATCRYRAGTTIALARYGCATQAPPAKVGCSAPVLGGAAK
jgi:hypothetical protein